MNRYIVSILFVKMEHNGPAVTTRRALRTFICEANSQYEAIGKAMIKWPVDLNLYSLEMYNVLSIPENKEDETDH